MIYNKYEGLQNMKSTRQCLVNKGPTNKIYELNQDRSENRTKCVRDNYCHCEGENLESFYKHLACIIKQGLKSFALLSTRCDFYA